MVIVSILHLTYLKGIKMQSPFCILTSYHGKFRNLGNLYISTFSTSTWLYCPSWIHPVSSTSALSFLREKFLTSDHKIAPMEIQGHSHICQLDKLAEIFLGYINIHHFQSTNEEMKCFINGVKRRSTRLVRFSSKNYDWPCLNRTWIIIHEPEEISVSLPTFSKRTYSGLVLCFRLYNYSK